MKAQNAHSFSLECTKDKLLILNNFDMHIINIFVIQLLQALTRNYFVLKKRFYCGFKISDPNRYNIKYNKRERKN